MSQCKIINNFGEFQKIYFEGGDVIFSESEHGYLPNSGVPKYNNYLILIFANYKFHGFNEEDAKSKIFKISKSPTQEKWLEFLEFATDKQLIQKIPETHILKNFTHRLNLFIRPNKILNRELLLSNAKKLTEENKNFTLGKFKKTFKRYKINNNIFKIFLDSMVLENLLMSHKIATKFYYSYINQETKIQ